MCAGDPWAAESRVGGSASGNSTDVLPELRMSLHLDQVGKPIPFGRQATRDAPPAEITWAPLRLTPLLGLRPDGIATATPGATSSRAGTEPAGAVGVRTVAGDQVSARSGISDDEGLPQPSAPVPFDPAPSGAVSRRSPPTPAGPATGPGQPGAGLPDLSAESWTMAPIRWQGNSTSSGTVFNDEGSSNIGINNSLALTFNSFIVAPYIATWAGNVGLNSSSNRSIPEVGPTTKGESSGHNLGGNISVFPVSSFPFTAYFGYAKSEFTSGDFRKVPNTSSAFGFEQQYRTEDGRDRYSARYDRSSLISGSNEGSSSTMQGSFSTRRVFPYEHFLEGEHSFNANLVYSPASTDVSGQGGQLLNASFTHGWRVHEDLSISNLLSVVDNQLKQFQGNTLTTNDSTLLLGASTFNWRPDEDWPLDVSGGASFGYTQSQTAVGAGQTSQNYFAASLSANYRYSNQLSLSAGTSVATTASDSGRINVANANAGAYYTGVPIQFDAYTYGWSAGGGVNANVSSTGGNTVGANASLSHNLVRNIVIDERQGATLSAGQSLSYNVLPDASAVSLSNSIGAGWRASYSDALSASLGASAGFTTGTDSSQSLTASLIGNGHYLISSRQSLSLNCNVNWTQIRSSDTQPQVLNETVIDNNQTQVTGILSVGYAHTSPFSIRNLSYTADLLWVGSQSSQRLVGAGTVSSGYGTSVSLQQMLRYRVGRLSFNLSASVIDSGGRMSNSVFGSVTRDFDGFFDGRW